MLVRLSIRDIIIIDRLDIDFASGLSVLTGETGAGKSILLDAFALALGGRGNAALVREGVEPRTVWTKLYRVPVTVSPGETNVAFVQVEEGMAFPVPSRADLEAYDETIETYRGLGLFTQ